MQKLIGKRILFVIRAHGQEANIREGKVQCFSPNGKFVKIGGEWFKEDLVAVQDELEAPEKEAKVAKVEEKAEKPGGSPDAGTGEGKK